MPRTHIDVDGTDVEAYLALGPEGGGPGVLLFIDAFGLRARIEEIADRIASWGYVVLAPNTLYRSGPAARTTPTRDLREPGAREEFFRHALPRLRALTPERLAVDIPAYLRTLRGTDGVAVGPVGVTGYCMGVRLAIRAAGLDPEVAAVGGFHGGGLVTEDPQSPHRSLATARARFLFGHADADPSMPASAIRVLGDALAAAGLEAVNEVRPGAPHGYTMSDTASYDEQAAEWHFTALRELFDQTLH